MKWFELSRSYFLQRVASEIIKTQILLELRVPLGLIMCRSSQNIHSTMKESKRDSSTASSESDNVSILDQQNTEPTTAIIERPFQVENFKDILGKDTVSPSETSQALLPRRNVYHVKDQDINIALATFPEFFPRGLVVADQESTGWDKLAQPESKTLLSKGLSVGKQNLQSECGGLVLWYIREYGL